MNDARHHPINCGITDSVFLRTFTKQSVNQRSFDIALQYEPRLLQEGNIEPVILNDTNLLRSTQNVTVNDARIIVLPFMNRKAFLKKVKSSNTNIFFTGSPDSPLFFNNSTGSCLLSAELDTGETQVITAIAQASSPQTVDTFVSFVENSLCYHIYNEMFELCNNSTTKPNHYGYYNIYNTSNEQFTKNPNCWFSEFDLSGVCVATGSGNTRMCVAITPHHAIGIKHGSFHPQIGESVFFVANDNSVVSRVVQNVSYVSNFDCSVIRFNNSLPDNINKYKLLPSNVSSFLPNNRNFYNSNGSIQSSVQMHRCPVIVVSHYIADPSYTLQRNNRFVYVRDVDEAITDLGQGKISGNYSTHFPNYNGFFEGDTWLSPIRGGDSGGPCFAVINQELVLLGSHITAFSTGSLCAFLTEIQNTINTLGPSGQTIQTVDLSSFTDFSS
jgi:hypothetical protein